MGAEAGADRQREEPAGRAYCYLPLPLAKPGTEVEIELFGERVPAKVTLPIHDPDGERLKV